MAGMNLDSTVSKPRLDSAVLTREDTKIWLNINLPLNRAAPNPAPGIAYFKADRRDAALMLLQMEWRNTIIPRGNCIRYMDLHPSADWRAECRFADIGTDTLRPLRGGTSV